MKLPRLRSANAPEDTPLDEVPDESVVVSSRAYTPAKGRPTPKRRDAVAVRRGPAPPPPTTQREAMRRARGSKAERKAATAQRRARMAAGDEKALLPRDRGPVRAYVRDIVDSRRHLLGMFMPLAILVLVAMVAPVHELQVWAAPGTMVILVIMVLEGVWLGMTVTKRVRAKFPDAKDRGLSLGWYSFVRASQIRKLRIPKPTVKIGATIA